MIPRLRFLIVTTSLVLALPALRAETVVSRHDETASGLQGWKLQSPEIEIQLNPLTLEQVRAFYLGRGFSDTITDKIVDSCVFQTVIKNRTDPEQGVSVHIDLGDWKIVQDNTNTGLPTKASWLAEWQAMGASPAAQLAFRWATFPASQRYDPGGDYGWGMILFGLKPGSEFNLLTQWSLGNAPAQARIEQHSITGLACPAS